MITLWSLIFILNSIGILTILGCQIGTLKECNNKFNLSVIMQDSAFEIYKHFGFQSGKDIDKFETFSEARRAPNGIYNISKDTNSLRKLANSSIF